MAKFPTYPQLYNYVKTLDTTFLGKTGYLQANHRQSGIIKWSLNGNETGSISINVNTQVESPFIELDYKYKEIPINYKIQLIYVHSNLGKGIIWYFVCPKTGRRCRKLYLTNTYFYHRSAFGGCMYECQTQTKKYRTLYKTLGKYLRSDELYLQLYEKHFKKSYAGKPTKKYLSLLLKLKTINAS